MIRVNSKHLISAGLIGTGIMLCALENESLVRNPELDVPLNFMGINRSPYGGLLAIAMQGSIDSDFQFGVFGNRSHGEPGHVHDENCGSHVDEDDSHEAHEDENENTASDSSSAYHHVLESAISKMKSGLMKPTNPLPPSEGLKQHMRRETESKLSFAYQLDPSHYNNYNTLHFFFAEGLTTRPELIPSTERLAWETIDYCLKQEDDPRPALTAAAACHNLLNLMFTSARSDEPKYSIDQMRSVLAKLDECLSRYVHVVEEWNESDKWQRLSEQRIGACLDHFQSLSNARNLAAITIERLHQEGFK